jgi:hypothetical protein
MKSLAVALLTVLLFSSLRAGEGTSSVVLQPASAAGGLTGNLQVDFFGQQQRAEAQLMQSEVPDDATRRKSPWLAAGLSLLVPGAGEFYAENYWKAAAFLAIDIAAWSLAHSFDKKGDRQTDFFQNYANRNWSPGKYAKFALETYVPPAEWVNYNGLLASNWESRPPSEQVNWVMLNALERHISGTANGRYFSHTLPPYGDQQYFELIGKYQQFYQGWNDADPSLVTYDQISAKINSDYTNFKYYAGERGKANDFYTTATTYVTVAIVNHVLSAVDAAWTASSYNRHLSASMRIQTIPTRFGFVGVPVARLEYSF